MQAWVEVVLTIVGGLFIWSCSLIGATLWITGQFAELKRAFQSILQREKAELISSLKELDLKLDAHDRLDNERFKGMELAIMRIELREQNRGDIISTHQISGRSKI